LRAVEAGASAAQGRQGGPYIGVATACERVLQEQDNVLSVIRVIDRIIISAVGPEAPDEMPPSPVNFTLLLVIKSGGARGRYSVRLTIERPSGEQMPNEISLPLLLEGEDRGVNLIVPVGLQLDQEGLYWFDVTLTDPRVADREELLTRVPLRIVYQPQRYGAESSQ
jgi:hypothetical protein